jgi:hypothetical protein
MMKKVFSLIREIWKNILKMDKMGSEDKQVLKDLLMQSNIH